MIMKRRYSYEIAVFDWLKNCRRKTKYDVAVFRRKERKSGKMSKSKRIIVCVAMVLAVLICLSGRAYAGTTEYVTMRVGQTKSLSAKSSKGAINSAAWMSEDESAVRITSGKGSISCVVEALAKPSNNQPVLIHCEYNYVVYTDRFPQIWTGYNDYYITVTESDSGSSGSVSSSGNKAKKNDVSSWQINVGGVCVYDGTPQKPPITLVDGDGAVVPTKYYRVEYSNNVNAGTGTVTVYGNGSLTGKVSRGFGIDKATQKVKASVASNSVEVGDTLQIKADGIGAITYSSDDDSVATVDENGLVTARSAGKVTVTVKAAGNSNYRKGTATIEVKVSEAEPADIAECDIKFGANIYTYDGKAKRPDVVVADGKRTLQEGKDYTVTYKNNTNAGIATAVVSGKGAYAGTANVEFEIDKASQSLEVGMVASTIEVGSSSQIEAKGIGAVSYESDDRSVADVSHSGVVTGKKAGTSRIAITAAGDANHNPATEYVRVEVVEVPKQDERTEPGGNTADVDNKGPGNEPEESQDHKDSGSSTDSREDSKDHDAKDGDDEARLEVSQRSVDVLVGEKVVIEVTAKGKLPDRYGITMKGAGRSFRASWGHGTKGTTRKITIVGKKPAENKTLTVSLKDRSTGKIVANAKVDVNVQNERETYRQFSMPSNANDSCGYFEEDDD